MVRSAQGCALTVILLLAACMSSPRASSEIAQKTDPVTFSGVYEVPDVDLEIQAKNLKS
jgi:hypothetical protein